MAALTLASTQLVAPAVLSDLPVYQLLEPAIVHAAEPVVATSTVPILSPLGSESLLRAEAKARGVSADLTVAIATCESQLQQFNPDGTVLRGRVNHDDTGLLQINRGYHLEAAEKMGLDIDTLSGNIKYGVWLLSTAGTAPWQSSRYCWDK